MFMRGLFFSLLIFCLASCKEKFDSKTYEENKESLADREKNNPQQFLRISSDDKKNLFGTTVVKGKLVNTASVCWYKNIRVKMLCYKDGIRVEEHEDVIPDVIKPGNVKNFRTRYHLPKGTDSLALSVMTAEAVSDTLKTN